MALTDSAECRELPSSRQTTLLETLAAAASLLTAAEKTRPGAGPPPLLSFLRPLRPAPHLAAQTIDFAAVRGPIEQVKPHICCADLRTARVLSSSCIYPQIYHCSAAAHAGTNARCRASG